MFTVAFFITAKIWKQPKCPSTDEWIKLMYIHEVEYYSTTFAATQMDLEGMRCSEISQTEKDEYCVIPLIYGI